MIRHLLRALPALLCAAAVAAPAVVEDTLAQRLAPCTACHGKEGRAAADGYHPRIAGKPAGYLLNQLHHFRDGRRAYGPMVAMVAPLPEAYLREIAEHFAALDLPYPAAPRAAAAPALLDRGRQLVLHGDAARGLPACVECHGLALTGRLPATPGLLGLPRDYVVAQLGAWRHGQRRAHAPDCMAEVVRRLSGEDIAGLGAYLASQPVPVAAAPAAAPPPGQALPLRCGSAPAP